MDRQSLELKTIDETDSRLRVAINAQLSGNGAAGGVEQAVTGLVYGLGLLSDGDEEYIVVCTPEVKESLRELIGPNTRLFTRPLSTIDRAALNVSSLGLLRPLLPVARFAWRNAVLRGRGWQRGRRQKRSTGASPLGANTGIYERVGADVVHFPYQNMEQVDIPSIFTPWDFQHEHHPEFFSPESLSRRRSLYPAACQHASAIVAGTPSVRRDICRFAELPIEKVFLMPWGNPTEYAATPAHDERLEEVAAEYGLPKEFALYPAQTFPHKNHVRLLQALAHLRDRQGIFVHLVCTGAKNDHFDEIQHELVRLDLQGQVRFVGYVADSNLRALYQLATFVVFPSLFEGWGFPPLEALSEGVALACSRIEPLIEHVGDAALLFDPTSVESIAKAIGKLSSDPVLRSVLIKRGIESSETRSWDACARSHRALYRLLGGAPLTDEDRSLLVQAQPNVHPDSGGSTTALRPEAIAERN